MNDKLKPIGYVDEYDNFENSLKQWMIEEPNTTWKPVYSGPISIRDIRKDVLLEIVNKFNIAKNQYQSDGSP